MSEQVKGALVIGVSIIAATFVYTWTTAYFSPFEQCMRDESMRLSAAERARTPVYGGTGGRWRLNLPTDDEYWLRELCTNGLGYD